MAFVLIGFMGAGKSTAAAELAQALGATALDSDKLLEERFGHSVAREFERSGEPAFRAAEEELVGELLARAGENTVIALGGGSVCSARVRDALDDHLTIMLEVDPGVAWARVRGAPDGIERPLARDRKAFNSLYAQRKDLYEGIADAFLPSLGSAGAGAIARGLRSLAAAPRGTRLLWASAASGEYPVLVGRGLLHSDRLASTWPLDRTSSRPFCVSDEGVAALYGGLLGDVAGTITIPAGEASKTLASAERVWSALAEHGLTRADHLVALGGGVVGDLTGFCAATYQRGVAVVHVPTTVVAQVDSAYGGKTGVDLPHAKNYVGAYHQPAGVLADPDTLGTLAAAELAAGWVEALKTALIAGGALWETVGSGAELDEQSIVACARTKLAIVAEDERDAGVRQVLNLGHTVGHAIETVTGYARYRHGEAVGLGLLAALRLSGLDDLHRQVFELLAARGLPVALQGVEVESVVQATAKDKKRLGLSVPFVLLRAPGEPMIGCEVRESDLRGAVQELVG